MRKLIVDYRNVKLLKTRFSWIFLFYAAPFFFLVSCATTESKTDSAGLSPSTEKEARSYGPRPGRVWIYRSDGSKSCGVRKGVTLTSATNELSGKGVRIFNKRKKHDGIMRMMVCGADTGMQNELHIDGQSLPIAATLGYRLLGED